jgi:hypothetical protein
LPDENNRYWIKELNLFIGIWQGTKAEFTTNWLRWWDKSGNLLLWGSERVAQILPLLLLLISSLV